MIWIQLYLGNNDDIDILGCESGKSIHVNTNRVVVED